MIQAFLAAVQDVLGMQAAAVQALARPGSSNSGSDSGSPTSAHSRAVAQGAGGAAGASSSGQPPGTLLQLVVRLEAVGTQLLQLAIVCRCEPAQRGSDASAVAAEPSPRAPVAGQQLRDTTLPLPWPADAARWAEEWRLAPCCWQVQGFPEGTQLLDHLHTGAWGHARLPVASLLASVSGHVPWLGHRRVSQGVALRATAKTRHHAHRCCALACTPLMCLQS